MGKVDSYMSFDDMEEIVKVNLDFVNNVSEILLEIILVFFLLGLEEIERNYVSIVEFGVVSYMFNVVDWDN